MTEIRTLSDTRKTILGALSLALYWAAVLAYATSDAIAIPSGNVFSPAIGLLGLAGALTLFGAFPAQLNSPTADRIVRVVIVLCPLVDFACLFPLRAGIVVPDALTAAGHGLLGLSLGLVLSHMGPFLALLEQRTAAFTAVISFLGGAAIYVLIVALQLPGDAATTAALCLLSAITFTLANLTDYAKRQSFPDPVQQGAHPRQRPHRPLGLPRGFWTLAIGLLLYSVVYGLSASLTLVLSDAGDATLTGPVSLVLLGPGLILSIVLLRTKSGFDFRHFQWFLFVPSVVALLFLPFVDQHTGLLLCSLLILVFTFYDLASFVLLIDLSRGRRMAQCVRIFAWGRLMNILGMALGWMIARTPLGLGAIPSPNGVTIVAYTGIIILVVLMTVFGSDSFGMQAASPSLGKTGANKGDEKDAPAGEDLKIRPRFDERCNVVIERYGLSTREAEVLRLLARGHSTAHIADELCISPSTVKTHAYRIYRKLDIHSQQSIIDVVEHSWEKMGQP